MLSTRRVLCAVVSLSPLVAQSLQLSTANIAPAANYYHWDNWTASWPAPGPVTLPIGVGNPYVGLFQSVLISGTGDSLSLDVWGLVSQVLTHVSFDHDTSTDLVTTLITSSPARIRLVAQDTFQLGVTGAGTLPLQFAWGIDLGANGTDEFSTTSPQSTTATLTTWADAQGTDVRWHHRLFMSIFGAPGVAGAQARSQLTLQFDDPVQEQTYGPACTGALGCQRGSGTFDRIFVASLPGNTTYAWLVGGVAQQNVLFSGFSCPLLVDPVFILAVPVFQGHNGRRFVDFAATFPPVPGLTFYAQGIAVSGGTFVGTNGVVVQT